MYRVDGSFIEESSAVTTKCSPHFKIAIGGDFKESDKTIDLGTEIPLPAAPR